MDTVAANFLSVNMRSNISPKGIELSQALDPLLHLRFLGRPLRNVCQWIDLRMSAALSECGSDNRR